MYIMSKRVYTQMSKGVHMETRKRLNIDMDANEYIALKIKALEQGSFVSDIVRDLVSEYLKDVDLDLVEQGRKVYNLNKTHNSNNLNKK